MPFAIWLRHGAYRQQVDAPSAHQPHGLTASGRKQAEAAAPLILDWLQDNEAELAPVMHCSSLLRAWQTADILRTAVVNLGGPALRLQADDALCERSVGALANLDKSRIESVLFADPRVKALPDNWKSARDFRLPVPGAESLAQAGRRVAAYVGKELERAAANQAVIFVGHGAAFRHAAFELRGLTLEEIARLSMHHASPLFFAWEQGRLQRVAGDWKQRERFEGLD